MSTLKQSTDGPRWRYLAAGIWIRTVASPGRGVFPPHPTQSRSYRGRRKRPDGKRTLGPFSSSESAMKEVHEICLLHLAGRSVAEISELRQIEEDDVYAIVRGWHFPRVTAAYMPALKVPAPRRRPKGGA